MQSAKWDFFLSNIVLWALLFFTSSLQYLHLHVACWMSETSFYLWLPLSSEAAFLPSGPLFSFRISLWWSPWTFNESKKWTTIRVPSQIIWHLRAFDAITQLQVCGRIMQKETAEAETGASGRKTLQQCHAKGVKFRSQVLAGERWTWTRK